MRRLSLVSAVLMTFIGVLLVLPTAGARAQDVGIPIRQPIRCPASGPIYPYYSTTDQTWHCTSTSPAILNGSAVTATAAELNVLHSVTAGTARASSAVVLDANSAINVLRTASLRLGTSGSETAVTATGAEVNTLHSVTAGTIAASSAVVMD